MNEDLLNEKDKNRMKQGNCYKIVIVGNVPKMTQSILQCRPTLRYKLHRYRAPLSLLAHFIGMHFARTLRVAYITFDNSLKQ